MLRESVVRQLYKLSLIYTIITYMLPCKDPHYSFRLYQLDYV